MQQKILTLVIPAYNEAEALENTLPTLIDYCGKKNWGITIIDDGSTDDTKSSLSKYIDSPELNVIHHKINVGYGGALKTGIASVDTNFVVTFDADGQHSISDINALLKVIQDADADMVIGSRKHRKKPSLFREIGKWIIRKFTQILLPMDINDLNSGFKLSRTKRIQQYLHLCPDSMAFSEVITMIFVNQRHLVLEHPVTVGNRIAGKSTITTRTAFETILEILNIIMLINPMRIFLPIAFISIFIGLAWGLPIILLGRGVSVGSMLAIVTGLLFFFLGLVAEQLSLIRKELLLLRQKNRTDSL